MSSFFGNPWMLAALVAASLPWIIEWLFRRRKRQVDLPTIRYLLKNKDQEKIKRQDRILLILRTVALALLVLALTRPRVQQGAGKTVRKRNVVMVIDGTASMNQQVGVLTAFDLAQKKAAAIVQGIEGAAAVTVLELGSQVETIMENEEDLHTAAAHEFARLAELRPRPLLASDLQDPGARLNRGSQGDSLGQGHGHGFLEIDILACGDGGHGQLRVPVVGRADDDGVDVRARQQFAVVSVG